MMVEQSLLDLLAIQMKCRYLSDLRFLTKRQRQYLAQELERLTPREEDIQEWNDALNYLTGRPPENTAQAAKVQLIQTITRPYSESFSKARTRCDQCPAKSEKDERTR